MQYTYDKGNLSSIQRTNNFKSQIYSFTYDNFGNMLTAAVGGRTLSTNTYLYDTGLLSQQTYGNGDVVSFTYDMLGRTKTATYDDGRVLKYVYNGEGRLHSLTETKGSNTVIYLYTYDSLGRLIHSEQVENGNTVLRASQRYNENNQLTGQSWQLGSTAYSEGYTYNSADGSQNIVTSYDYDPYGKVISATGTLAGVNPLRYRGYVYDWETGFYYLQSRYYDPTIGRFLNVDGYVSTGQGIIGHNMFAYCGNNPVINEDKTGQFFLNAAIQLLKRWLNGDGTTQYYGEKTAPVKALKRSEKMREKVNEAILNYQNDSSNYYVRDTVEFTRDDGWNSYLAFGAVSYIITVRTETRTRGVWFWKHEQTRYVAEVMVSDFYNFDSKPWSGLGNILNNGAAILHCFGVGKDYYWEANYSYATKWERSS